MATVKQGNEIIVTLGNTVGTGAGLYKKLKEADVNVVASSASQVGGEVHFNIVPDNLERALEVLRDAGLEPGVQDVLLVEMPNVPGAFAQLLQDIAELGVSVRSAYATTSVKERALAVLKTDDDAKVVQKMS